MKTIAVTNNKGGVGKTFIAVHIAWYMNDRGKKVLVIDTDIDQADAVRWISGHKIKEPEIGKIIRIKDGLDVVWNIQQDTQIELKKYDIAIIDGRPNLSIGAKAIYPAHIIIIPVEGRLSTEHAKEFLTMLGELLKAKKRIVVVNKQYTKAKISKIQLDLARLIDADLYPFPIVETPRVREAENLGKPLWQVRKTPMRRIFEDFLGYIYNEVEKI
jgi:chromosome partitioning protein